MLQLIDSILFLFLQPSKVWLRHNREWKGTLLILEGVNIIKTIVDASMNEITLWCATIGCLLFACAMMIEAYDNWKSKNRYYSLGICFVAIVCVLVIGISWSNVGPGETRYVVTVEDSVNFNEFCDKYEIIERNGSEYIVREVG